MTIHTIQLTDIQVRQVIEAIDDVILLTESRLKDLEGQDHAETVEQYEGLYALKNTIQEQMP